jgi:hypothetical protein
MIAAAAASFQGQSVDEDLRGGWRQRGGFMHELLGPLVLFAAALCLTPGPNVVLVTASAANFGFRRTIPQMLGITLGFGFMVLAAGFGLAGLFHAEPRLHTALKYAGATYLLYLAWRIAHADATGRASTRAKPINFVEAALFTWINPKGDRGRRADGLHDRGRRRVAANRGDCERARGSVLCIGRDMGRVRRGARAFPGKSARPQGVQLVDGRLAGAFSHTGVPVAAERIGAR